MPYFSREKDKSKWRDKDEGGNDKVERSQKEVNCCHPTISAFLHSINEVIINFINFMILSIYLLNLIISETNCLR